MKYTSCIISIFKIISLIFSFHSHQEWHKKCCVLERCEHVLNCFQLVSSSIWYMGRGDTPKQTWPRWDQKKPICLLRCYTVSMGNYLYSSGTACSRWISATLQCNSEILYLSNILVYSFFIVLQPDADTYSAYHRKISLLLKLSKSERKCHYMMMFLHFLHLHEQNSSHSPYPIQQASIRLKDCLKFISNSLSTSEVKFY